ncbi:hypothetical protein [Micromonospora sp. 067-2]
MSPPRRAVLRTLATAAYGGRTLREHCGLPRPASAYAAPAPVSA